MKSTSEIDDIADAFVQTVGNAIGAAGRCGSAKKVRSALR